MLIDENNNYQLEFCSANTALGPAPVTSAFSLRLEWNGRSQACLGGIGGLAIGVPASFAVWSEDSRKSCWHHLTSQPAQVTLVLVFTLKS